MKAFLQVASVLVCVGLVHSATYTIVCTDNSAGYCTSWDVNNEAVCFPADARVKTRQGLTPMHALKRGDELLGLVEGTEQFTKLTSWLHRSEDEADYLAIETEKGEVVVSGKHNVATTHHGYQLAEDAAELRGAGKVSSVRQVRAKGMYSPRTQSSNYFIYLNGSEDRKILAHNYAHIRNPEFYEPFVNAIEGVWDMFDSQARHAQKHPSHAWMQETFKILQE